jgi:hypothetical protein
VAYLLGVLWLLLNKQTVIHETLLAATFNIIVVCDVTPFSLEKINHPSKGTRCFDL